MVELTRFCLFLCATMQQCNNATISDNIFVVVVA